MAKVFKDPSKRNLLFEFDDTITYLDDMLAVNNPTSKTKIMMSNQKANYNNTRTFFKCNYYTRKW